MVSTSSVAAIANTASLKLTSRSSSSVRSRRSPSGLIPPARRPRGRAGTAWSVPPRGRTPDATAAGDDPVARDDDRYGVAAHGVADGPGRARAPGHLRQLAVRDGLAEPHVAVQGLVHRPWERRVHGRQVDRHREATPVAAEVLVDLDRDLVVTFLAGVHVEIDRTEADLLHAAVTSQHREHPDRSFLPPPARGHPGSSSCTSARSSSSSSVVTLIFS